LLSLPPLAVADVTDDDRVCGGTLAATTAAEMTRLLGPLGIR
jgi:hypothetical protein